MPSPTEPQPRSGFSFLALVLRAVGLIFALAFFIPPLLIAASFARGPLSQEKTVFIPFGSSPAETAANLSKENAVYFPILFRIAARIVGPLKAGEYALLPRMSAFEIAKIAHEGRSIVRTFTAAEGLTSAEIVRLLNADPALSGDILSIPQEGSLLPETYRYSFRDSRASLIARMQKAMKQKIFDLWAKREDGLPLKSSNEALVLASIVEKETGRPEERARIAGVFYNRLRINMRLQSDPTVIYALTLGRAQLNRTLTRGDLYVASPINTYISAGIPPQPICNPGQASIEAVLHPERHSLLYFVADGNGGHAFASDLATHNKNINVWHTKLKNPPKP